MVRSDGWLLYLTLLSRERYCFMKSPRGLHSILIEKVISLSFAVGDYCYALINYIIPHLIQFVKP